MVQHTPGPWKYEHSTWGDRRRISGNHVAVAEVVDSPEGLANARLIAAAPEMLAEGRALIRAIEAMLEARHALTGDVSQGCARLGAAIAKAEGR